MISTTALLERWRVHCRRTYLLLPTPRIMVAEPVFSARAANAAAVDSGVSPAAIAACFRSFSIFCKRLSVFLAPEP